MFQFHLVRLKADAAAAIQKAGEVSIPSGTVKRKRERLGDFRNHCFNSIWYG